MLGRHPPVLFSAQRFRHGGDWVRKFSRRIGSGEQSLPSHPGQAPCYHSLRRGSVAYRGYHCYVCDLTSVRRVTSALAGQLVRTGCADATRRAASNSTLQVGGRYSTTTNTVYVFDAIDRCWWSRASSMSWSEHDVYYCCRAFQCYDEVYVRSIRFAHVFYTVLSGAS